KINANGKDIEGWVSQRFLINKDQILEQSKSQLAVNGYGQIGSDVDAGAAKVIVSGDVNDATDKERIKELLLRVDGVTNVDVANLKVSSSPPVSSPRTFTHLVPSHLWMRGIEQLQQMLSYASTDGGIAHESAIAEAKRR